MLSAQGVDKLRLNPGNLRHVQEVREVVAAARERHIPIRIGVNNGSIKPQIRQQFPFTPLGNAHALVANALEHITILEQLDYHEIVVSLKASDIPTTIYAYRLMTAKRPYPLHIGVTEAGLPAEGLIKSGIGIGQLLAEGIGDTLRVSLTADPQQEVAAGWEILRSLHLRSGGISITACPTCGRCDVNLQPLVGEAKAMLAELDKELRLTGRTLHIALMGCEVNGPGEASDADLGIACGKKSATLFRQGKIIKKISDTQIVTTIFEETARLLADDGAK